MINIKLGGFQVSYFFTCRADYSPKSVEILVFPPWRIDRIILHATGIDTPSITRSSQLHPIVQGRIVKASNLAGC